VSGGAAGGVGTNTGTTVTPSTPTGIGAASPSTTPGAGR
jgi:hypothetical protein